MKEAKTRLDIKKMRIPQILNILLTIAATTIAILLLFSFQRADTLLIQIACAIGFSFIANTIFSLLHEAVHGILVENKKANYYLGVYLSAFFPTSFSMQQIFHLGHHKRNRTDAEIFDQYYENDNIWVKRFVIYFLLTGLYWTSAPFACLIYLFCPWIFKVKWFRKSESMKRGGFDDMLSGLDRKGISPLKIRIEITYSILFQASLFYFLNLSFTSWIACYYAFAFNWSALQYTDHAWSERDIRNGAWNLRINPIVEKIFLNYHTHLSHHQYPNLPWIHLPKVIDNSRRRPSFWEIYLKLWKGPTPVTEGPPTENTKEFNHEIESAY